MPVSVTFAEGMSLTSSQFQMLLFVVSPEDETPSLESHISLALFTAATPSVAEQ